MQQLSFNKVPKPVSFAMMENDTINEKKEREGIWNQNRRSSASNTNSNFFYLDTHIITKAKGRVKEEWDELEMTVNLSLRAPPLLLPKLIVVSSMAILKRFI